VSSTDEILQQAVSAAKGEVELEISIPDEADVPPGQYQAIVQSIQPHVKRDSTDGKPTSLAWRFVIEEEPYAGAEVVGWSPITGRGMAITQRWFRAVGLGGKKWRPGDPVPNTSVLVTIVEGQRGTKVNGVSPLP